VPPLQPTNLDLITQCSHQDEKINQLESQGFRSSVSVNSPCASHRDTNNSMLYMIMYEAHYELMLNLRSALLRFNFLSIFPLSSIFHNILLFKGGHRQICSAFRSISFFIFFKSENLFCAHFQFHCPFQRILLQINT
jgi:hypothetical protein